MFDGRHGSTSRPPRRHTMSALAATATRGTVAYPVDADPAAIERLAVELSSSGRRLGHTSVALVDASSVARAVWRGWRSTSSAPTSPDGRVTCVVSATWPPGWRRCCGHMRLLSLRRELVTTAPCSANRSRCGPGSGGCRREQRPSPSNERRWPRTQDPLRAPLLPPPDRWALRPLPPSSQRALRPQPAVRDRIAPARPARGSGTARPGGGAAVGQLGTLPDHGRQLRSIRLLVGPGDGRRRPSR